MDTWTCGLKCILFYLNYVGCKAELVNGKHTDRQCFTLTMWDVKILFAVIAFAAILCFTLTMWDVKDVYAGNLVNFNIVLP